MDARTRKDHSAGVERADEARSLAEAIVAKRDRLLASLTLIAGIGLIVGLPFALRMGAEFFMPVTAALVVAIALVPLLEWFERRGIPSKLAAGLCVLVFLLFAIFAIGSILVPASDWVAQVPTKITKVRSALEPIFDLYKNLDRFIDKTVSQIEVAGAQSSQTRAVRIETPNSMLGLLTSSAPHLLIQLFFALLVIFFFLAGWTAMRKKTIVSRGSFEGALTTARVIQQVVDATSAYLGTITLVNLGIGALLALILWLLGMPTPLMWGGIAAMVLIASGILFGFQLGVFFSVAMVAFAGAAVLYDTSNVIHHFPEDRYVGAALELFASVALMFWYVIRIFLATRD